MDDEGHVEQILTSVRRLTLDYHTGVQVVEFADGRVAAGINNSAANSAEAAGDIQASSYDVSAREITFFSTDGAQFVAEIGRNSDPDDRRARPIIYLDQNHWITLARRIHNPSKVQSSDMAPSERIIELARAQKIILPLSAGHLVETTRAHGGWRRNLAPVMMELSRGWQMLHPVDVRHAELDVTFTRLSGGLADMPVGNDIFGLTPRMVFGRAATPPPESELSADLPSAMRDLAGRTSWVASIYSILLENDAIPTPEGDRAAEAWARRYADLAVELRDNRQARTNARKITLVKYLLDLRPEMAEAALRAGISAERFEEWAFGDAEFDIAACPSVGLAREAVHHRLMNADDHWEANDLTDLNFLACATAYADVVVAERKATGYLTRAWRARGTDPPIVRSLPALVDRLETLVS
ncbi:hypothetical protein AB0E59_38955 [Lentzea sp. NPDC034063]|uniref:hypothetical protein n=1 Tax=unclassified Lentzea TaxID=2643253 RepID=UPI0034045315